MKKTQTQAQDRTTRALWAKVKEHDQDLKELRTFMIEFRLFGRLALILTPLLTSTASGIVVWLLTRKT